MAGMYFRPISKPASPAPPPPVHKIDETFFIPTSEKAYTFNPLEKNPKLVYLPASINYNQYLKDVEAYRSVAQQAASPASSMRYMGYNRPTPYQQAESMLADLRKKYPNIGKPSEEDIARATPNIVAQVEQPAPALVRSKASGSGALNTIGARRRGGRGG